MIRLLVGLLVVFGGLLLARWWLSRGTWRAHRGLTVISRASLSRNSSVAVVEVGQGNYYLVGVSDQGVALLDRLAPGVVEELVPRPAPEPAPVNESPLEIGGIVFEGERTDVLSPRPGSGLLDRMRRMTVRAPGRVPPDVR